MSRLQSTDICRACLEPSEKMYPLIGTVINVNVDIATMIAFCTSKELELDENLPHSVCIPCFKTIRIAYNFFQNFKVSEEKLLMQKDKQIIPDFECETVSIGCEYETVMENNNSDTELDCVTYSFETIHNYAEPSIDTVDEERIRLIVSDNKESNLGGSNSNELLCSLNDSDSCKEMSTIEESETNNGLLTSNKDLCINVYSCPLCTCKFTRLQKFNDHILLHKADVIVCNKCPRAVEFSATEFILHYSKFHRYQCNLCNKSLTSSYGFRYHMKQHENIRQFVCPVESCKKTYFLKDVLKRHMLTHSKTKKYKCNRCKASFKLLESYKYHMKTHDGKRDHLCMLCGKAFYQAVHLRDHMFRHTGYKPFTCDGCGRSFTTISQLKKHFKHCLHKLAYIKSSVSS